MKLKHEPGPPMTLGNMRQLSCPSGRSPTGSTRTDRAGRRFSHALAPPARCEAQALAISTAEPAI